MLRSLFDDCVTAMLPDVCPGCGARGTPVCDACVSTMRPAPVALAPPGIDWWYAPFSYEGVAREMVARAKYRHDRRLLRWLAGEMLRGCPRERPVDVVTWAPASSARVRAYGVDHGQLLARAVAADLHCRCRSLLVRAPGVPQTGAPRAVRARGPGVRATQSVRGMNVLVVDDVATTGATLLAVANALYIGEARTIAALTATRTPRQHRR